jgi:predicted CxxxxCH...CXXCH cytochrome family protein
MIMKKSLRHNIISSFAMLCALSIPVGFLGGLLPVRDAAAAVITCSNGTTTGCHFAPTGVVKDGTGRNAPDGRFLGTHQRHAGYSTATKREYNFACTKCHPSASYTNAHQSGFKNITGSSLPRASYSQGNKIANTNSPTFGNCANIYCHSNGRGTNMGQKQYSSAKWGGTETCLGCHGGRNVSGNPARSVGNFTLSTSHSQHLKYPSANINCQTCHYKTAASNTALKNYSGVSRHVNNVRDVTFSGIAYSSYTSYKSTETGSAGITKTCNNNACHGGKSRNVWSATTTNNDNACLHCHGQGTGTGTALRADKFNAAPGFGGTGISTDGNTAATDLRVGAHFLHLSSAAYMPKLKCNECHTVPSTPFEGNHMAVNRYNSSTLSFTQASTAVKYSKVPTFVAGTAATAATCSNTHCHSGKTGTGSAPTPSWNDTAYLTNNTRAATLVIGDCTKCHAMPPTPGSGSHVSIASPVSGFPINTQCGGNCHTNLSTTATTYGAIFADKSKHVNGVVEGGHAWPYPGATHGPSAGAWPYSGCTGCHTAYLTAGTYPFTRGNAALVYCTACHKDTSNFNSANQGCGDCHGADGSGSNGRPSFNVDIPNAFPNISGSHGKHVVGKGYACAECHGAYGSGSTNHGSSGGVASSQTIAFVHVTSTSRKFGDFTFTKKDHTTAGKGSCANNSCHGLAEWGVDKLDCISCHSSQVLIENGALAGKSLYRAAVAASIKSSGSKNHKSTAIGSDATKYDCIVCHMEGDSATGGTSAVHGNGVIDFRDPDTGSQAKKVEWSGGAALGNSTGGYTQTMTNFTTARFSRDLSQTLDADSAWLKVASIQVNLCLKCHDNDGAIGGVWSKAANGTSNSSTALRPFGGTAVTSTATAYQIQSATVTSAAGNTVGSVMNVSSSFETTNASYHPVSGRQNNYFAAGSRMRAPWGNTTKTGGGTRGATTVYGFLLSCFDCHSAPGATGVQDHTDVAHGNGSTGNAAVLISASSAWIATTNICTNCHAGYTASTSIHATGSAWGATGSQHNTGVCAQCHTNNATNAQGLRAVEAHGYNVMMAGGTGNTLGTRPYAFMRSATNMGNWAPGSCASTSGCTGTTPYTPGGTY